MREWAARDWVLVRTALYLAGATAAMLVAAVGVIYCVHVSRQMVTELQVLQRDSEQAQVEWGQLLLEKSAWGSYANVETTAHEKLGMYVPAVKDVVVVAP